MSNNVSPVVKIASRLMQKNHNPSKKEKKQVRVARDVYFKNIRRRIIMMLQLGFGALFIVYLCFAATILRVIPSFESPGFIAVKNLNDDGGIAQPGTQLLVSTVDKEVKSGFGSRFVQAFIPTQNTAIVNVVGGPYGRVQWNEAFTVLDNNPVLVKMSDNGTAYLNNDYLVECVKGDCEKTKGFIVSMNSVYGETVSREGGN